MAKRIATEYKQLVLELSSRQLTEFMDLFKGKDFPTEVRIYENGDTEFILYDEGDEIPLAFRNLGHLYQYEGSYVIKNLQLAQAMRKAVHEFKGTALVNRIYSTHMMQYHYENGSVLKIEEIKAGKITTIYEYQDVAGRLERLYAEKGAEDQIAWIKLQIDQLLDQRLQASFSLKKEIDEQLENLTHELFVLEA